MATHRKCPFCLTPDSTYECPHCHSTYFCSEECYLCYKPYHDPACIPQHTDQETKLSIPEVPPPRHRRYAKTAVLYAVLEEHMCAKCLPQKLMPCVSYDVLEPTQCEDCRKQRTRKTAEDS
jgi:hypothetical protein